MSDLISRQAAIDEVNKHWINGTSLCTADKTEKGIKHIPAADVVEVVRCKDCKHYNEYENGEKIIDEEEAHDGWCMRWSGIENVNRHDYCSYGERREQ